MKFKGTKDLAYWKANAEENYLTTPISVLRYITVLENQKAPEMLEMLKKVLDENHCTPDLDKEIEQLIKEATEL